MRTITKILWYFPLLGFINAVFAFATAIIFYITVLGTPLGAGLMELGKFFLKPFSLVLQNRKEAVKQYKDLWSVFGFFARILYLPFGIFLVNLVLIQIAILYISIVGIPMAKILLKAIPHIFNPVNKECISIDY